MKRPLNVRAVSAATVAVLVAGAVGVASGAIPGAGGAIDGCYSKVGGNVRVIDKAQGQVCSKLETAITWQQSADRRAPRGRPAPLARRATPAPGGRPQAPLEPQARRAGHGRGSDRGPARCSLEPRARRASYLARLGPPVASFDVLDGLPCTRSGQQGTIALSYGASGSATLTCVLPGCRRPIRCLVRMTGPAALAPPRRSVRCPATLVV